MKFRSLAGGACCLLILGCGGADQEATAGEPEEAVAVVDDETALDELTNYYTTHYNMGHASMVADLYAEDAGFMAANGQVHEGREAISAYMDGTIQAMSPELTITQADRMVIGDHAVSIGNYALSGEMEGEAAGFEGAFLNVLQKQGDEWKIIGVITNYATETTADMWVGMPEGAEDPPEEGTLTGLVDAYETHYNLGHPSMVADLYTDDATVSFPGQPWVSGREAIAGVLEQAMEGSPQIDIHAVNTLDLGDGMAVDAGWYEIDTNGTSTWGTYALLAHQNAEGDWQIHWLVGNVSPAS